MVRFDGFCHATLCYVRHYMFSRDESRLVETSRVESGITSCVYICRGRRELGYAKSSLVMPSQALQVVFTFAEAGYAEFRQVRHYML